MDELVVQQLCFIAVVSRKPYWMPLDEVFMLVWAGVALYDEDILDGWFCDNEGESISPKNPISELENRPDISAYSDNGKRVFGFVSECLLDPWTEAKNIAYTEMSVLNLERQLWLQKGTSFLRHKITDRK